MVAGKPVRVLDDTLFIDIHKNLLSTHSAHAVRKVLGGHT